MLIRLAATTDLPPLMELVRHTVPLMHAAGNHQWDASYPNEDIFARDIDYNELWIAETTPGTIAGVVAITTDQSPEYADIGWNIHELAIVIHRLAVNPQTRGAGVAGALMQHAEKIARQRGIARLLFDTSAQNEAAQRLILSCGYKFAGVIALHFRPGLRFFCYEKRLAQLDTQTARPNDDETAPPPTGAP